MNQPYHDSYQDDSESLFPVTEATTEAVKEEIQRYRDLGITDDEMRISRDFPGGEEIIAFSNTAAIKLAKLGTQDGYATIGKLKAMGIDPTLDQELDIVAAGEANAERGAYLASVEEIMNKMTLDGLRLMRCEALKRPGVRDGLGTRKYREYIDREIERIGRRYGWSVILNDPVLCKDTHTLAVILNCLSIGDPDMDGLKDTEEGLNRLYQNATAF
jgi:hypothetical protein